MLQSNDGKFNYRIRLAVIRDLDVILKNWWRLIDEQSFFDKRAKHSDINYQKSKSFLTSLIEREFLMIAVETGDIIIGMGTTYPDGFFLTGGHSVWNIADVWVEPRVRRNGVASNLVSKLEELSKQLGAQEVRLDVYSGNVVAISLYKSLGFGILKETLSKKF